MRLHNADVTLVVNFSEIYSATKGISDTYDIIIVLSRHCEVVVKLEKNETE